jgi:molybdopterin/thiamine biosynthesis adenylyltransferase
MSLVQKSGLESAKVLVVGAGVLGNEVLKNLVLAGVSNITLVDKDRVEPHNINCCILFDYRSAELNEFKVQAINRVLNRLDVKTNLKTYTKNIEEMPESFLQGFDSVLGCVDNIEARIHLNAQCYYHSVPYIDGGIDRTVGKVQVVLPPETACLQCSLNATHLRELGRRFSCTGERRTVIHRRTETDITTASITAAMQVREAVKLIQGQKEKTIKNILFYNGTTNQFEILTADINPSCPLH